MREYLVEASDVLAEVKTDAVTGKLREHYKGNNPPSETRISAEILYNQQPFTVVGAFMIVIGILVIVIAEIVRKKGNAVKIGVLSIICIFLSSSFSASNSFSRSSLTCFLKSSTVFFSLISLTKSSVKSGFFGSLISCKVMVKTASFPLSFFS